jgi:hypothetical protein
MRRLGSISLDNNKLTENDISILARPEPFCAMFFHDNQVSTLTNVLGIKFGGQYSYGLGYVDATNNNFTRGKFQVLQSWGRGGGGGGGKEGGGVRTRTQPFIYILQFYFVLEISFTCLKQFVS